MAMRLSIMVASRQRRIVRLMACAMLVFSGLLNAQSTADTHLKVELIAEQATSPAGQSLWVGLMFRLDQGWHIYWQNPGDSGEPPKIQWELPTGFVAGSIRWPQPIRLGSGSIADYGYEGQLLLMAPIEGPSTRNSSSLSEPLGGCEIHRLSRRVHTRESSCYAVPSCE